ncbi:hypothetical protein GLU26_02045 [Nanohaloarchaea archaeon]|nr:hypothetical protein [Candidatus Nanohaloarchaea archaeon]
MVHGDDGNNEGDDSPAGSAFDDSPDVSFSEPEPIDESDNDTGSDSDNDDDSTVVTVVGDPGSKEGLTTVGRGDTIEESERDAALNEDFDADEGTDIDDFEESFGTDQPDINPDDSESSSKSVVVTDNQEGEQETVAVAQTDQGAKVQAAANPRFDADKGTEIDAVETGLGFDQGDGTDANVISNLRGNNKGRNTGEGRSIDRQDVRDLDPVESNPIQEGRLFESSRERRRETERAFQEKPTALANLFRVGSDAQGFETAEDVAFRQADSLQEQKNIDQIEEPSVDERVRNRVDQLVAADVITEEERNLVEATATSASVEEQADILSQNPLFQAGGDVIAAGESFFVDAAQAENQLLENLGLENNVGRIDRPDINQTVDLENDTIENLPQPPANATVSDQDTGIQDINASRRGDRRAGNLAGLVLDPAQFVTAGRQFKAGTERAIQGQTEGDLTEEAVAAGTVGAGVLAQQVSRDPLGFAIEEGLAPGAAVSKGTGFQPRQIGSNVKDSVTASEVETDPAFQVPEDFGSEGRTGEGRDIEGTASFQPEGTQDVAGRVVGNPEELQRINDLSRERSPEEAVQLVNERSDRSISLTDIVLGGDRLPDDTAVQAEVLNPDNIEAVDPLTFTPVGGTETVQPSISRTEALREEFGVEENRQEAMFQELERQERREQPDLSERAKDVLTNTRKGELKLVQEQKPSDVDTGNTVDTERLVDGNDRRQDVADKPSRRGRTERDPREEFRETPTEKFNDRIEAGADVIGFTGTGTGIDLESNQGIDQRQDQGTDVDQPIQFEEDQTGTTQGQGRGTGEAFGRTNQRTFEERVEETFGRSESASRGRSRLDFDLDEDENPNQDALQASDPGAEEDPSAAPSVDAILFGDTSEEEISDEEVFSGFETREVEETFDFKLF